MESFRRLLLILKRFRRSDSGQGLLEFAVIVPVLLLVFFGVFEFGRFYFTRVTLQQAVAEAARFAITGEVLPDPDSGDPMSRAQSIIAVIHKNAHTLDIDVDRITLTPPDAGGPGDVVTVNAEFSFEFVVPLYDKLVPGGKIDFEVSTAMKNEPFITGQAN